MSSKAPRIAALALALGVAVPAVAQVGPGNIDDRVRPQLDREAPAPAATAAEPAVDELVLLDRFGLFTLYGGTSVVQTDNAFLAAEDRRADTVFQLEGGLRLATLLGGTVDAWADVGLAGSRFARHGVLDYDAFTGELGLATRVVGVDLTATYAPSIVFARGFGRRQLTQHGFRLEATRRLMLGPVAIDPAITGERAVARPNSYDAWTVGAHLAVTLPLSRRLPIFAHVRGGYDHRSYDSYFEGLVGTKRKDDLWSAGAGISWTINRWGSAGLSYSFRSNGSTSDVNRYFNHSGGLSLSARVRF